MKTLLLVLLINQKEVYDENDLFKVRTPLKKSEQRRGTGIVSIKGAVCFNSKDKDYLVNIIKKLRKLVPFELIIKSKIKREDLCDEIKKALLYLEKYSTSKDKNKITYVMIPANHPEYEFPYNLEDRIKYNLNKINQITNRKIDHKVIKEDKGKSYIIEIKSNKYIEDNLAEIRKLGFQQSGSKLIKKLIKYIINLINLIYLMSSSNDDKTFNINIFKENQQQIESSTNKSESYILLANEQLNNKNKEFIQQIIELENTISDLENDNERMEKSITYQRGLLHNFNHIKNYQEEMIKNYESIISSNNKFKNLIFENFSKCIQVLYYTVCISCVLFLLSVFLTGCDFYTVSINIITLLSTFYSLTCIFKFDNENITDSMNKYTQSVKSYNTRVSSLGDDIKKITSKSDFISNLIDTC